jgi:hypothetical protein
LVLTAVAAAIVCRPWMLAAVDADAVTFCYYWCCLLLLPLWTSTAAIVADATAVTSYYWWHCMLLLPLLTAADAGY